MKTPGGHKRPVQQFELEELQGVSGLKGLRVAINMEVEESIKEPASAANKSTAKES